MNTREAYDALLAGAKIRMEHWPEDEYVFMKKPGYITNNEGETLLGLSSGPERGWEMYEDDKPVSGVLYRRAVKISHGCWATDLDWCDSKARFMAQNPSAVAYGEWEEMEEPEVCDE